ncbi:MAG: type II toxin-antitoxin system Phd/YefM family antitoxin [Firmicutes bacterium]|nr:type II toxin-antitoxin system Phd/YefM family antitoxin [Bacillota bacterium]
MKIKPSSYIRNDYSELSSYCKESGEPVYITKNGEGDVVVLSMEAYERMEHRIKHLEAKLYFMEKFREAEEYNRLHPETYTLEEFSQVMEDFINERCEADQTE